MKQLVFFVMLTLAAGGLLGAQTPPAAITVTGTLELKDGRFFLKSGSSSYYVRGLERHTDAIAGLKDGAQVTLEGSASTRDGQTEQTFIPIKLTLNGKAYDITPPAPPDGERGGRSGNPPADRNSPPVR
ncbi:MAG: hypothetical protein LBG76_06625 [Treponema sp.]|jgi:hypothetical protein|nr:hypothetical protein [Treponema sp.]